MKWIDSWIADAEAGLIEWDTVRWVAHGALMATADASGPDFFHYVRAHEAAMLHIQGKDHDKQNAKGKTMTNKTLTPQPQSTEPAADQTFALLQQAVKAGTSPEALEKLLDLQERVMARNARSAFSAALEQFQARCPVIQKRKEVKDRSGRLMYRFAPLEDIVAQIRGLLAELGLSFSFNTDASTTSGGVTVTCTIRHRDGHAEPCSVPVPATAGHNTNASQNMGIQLTYGKRYALIGALGITTADEDADGAVQESHATITADQAATIQSLIEEVGADLAGFLRYMRAVTVAEIPAASYGRAISALEQKRRNK